MLLPRPLLPGAPGKKLDRHWATLRFPGAYDISYGAPWERLSGRDWREHLWRNRPCCFFHFTLEWWNHNTTNYGQYFLFEKHPPEHPAIVGGYHGEIYNRKIDHHVVFLFTRQGVHYDVTEHSFGRGTLPLLSRIVASLRAVPRA